MKMSDADRLDIALMHIDVLERHLERGPLEDPLVLDAVCQRLASAIEEIKQVRHELLLAEFGADWPKIVATRNVIAHSYRLVDPQLIASTTECNLAQLVAGVRSIRRGLIPPER